MSIEELDVESDSVNEYTINIRVEGYGGLSMDVKIPAKNPDEAFDLACRKEFRYQSEDIYVLMVVADDGDLSALCTYETLEEAILHVGTITSGIWVLVQRDFEQSGGVVIKTSDDAY